jgi:hypothetical protein
MQSLLTLLLRLSAKAWAGASVIVLCGGAATVFYLSSAKADPSLTSGRTPTLVQVGRAGERGHGGGLNRCGGSIPVVPEANGGLVLIPVVAAVLAASSRRLWSSKAPAAGDDQQARRES